MHSMTFTIIIVTEPPVTSDSCYCPHRHETTVKPQPLTPAYLPGKTYITALKAHPYGVRRNTTQDAR